MERQHSTFPGQVARANIAQAIKDRRRLERGLGLVLWMALLAVLFLISGN